MRLIINSNNFTDIGTAVFYSQSDLDNREYSKVQYRSNSSLLYNRDFSEYDFSYSITKDKFNDKFLVNYLGKNTLNLIGENSNSLEKIESTIFPTLSKEDWEEDDKYFGTTLISNQIFALFKGDPGIKRLELYEGIIDSNNISSSKFIDSDTLQAIGIKQTATPNFILILGELDEDSDEDNLVIKKELLDEVEGEKMIWMLISNNSEVEKINLSYRSWVDSINPNRNMNKYLVRNDEYWSTKDSIGIIDNIPNLPEILIDGNSGTFLGNERIKDDKLLILKIKKNLIERFKGSREFPNYYPFTTYKVGDKVYLGDKVWESVSNNNFNNNPMLSSEWILSNYLENSRPIRVVVSVFPEIGGTCNPIGIISIPSVDTNVTFKIYTKPGYKLNEDVPCILSTETLTPLPSENNFDYNIPENLITITDWRRILLTNNLIFNLSYVGSYVILRVSIAGEKTIYSYSEWGKLNETNLKILKLITGEGSSEVIDFNPYITKEGKLKLSIGKKAKLVIPELSRYLISKASLEAEDSTNIYYPVQDNGSNIISLPEINFSIATLTLELSLKRVIISIVEFEGFEISNNSIKVSPGGNAVFKFISINYPINNLEKIILEDVQGNSLTINKFSANGSTLDFGVSQVSLSMADINTIEEGEYTLKLMNIYYNTTIKLIKK